MFEWLKKRRTADAERPITAAFRFDSIEPVKASPQYGNAGSQGWGFTLRGTPDGEDFMYRHLLEAFAERNPTARLTLPEWYECEDLIEGSLIWHAKYVWVWYETALSHIWLWSADKEAIDSVRSAILPLAQRN